MARSKRTAPAVRPATVVGGSAEQRSPEVAAAIDRWHKGIPARIKIVDTLFGDDAAPVPGVLLTPEEADRLCRAATAMEAP